MEQSDVLRTRRAELGSFLKLRRGRLQPSDLGMPHVGRRHVKGLRREEIAEAAGIGSSWYTLLEQGRAPNVSARALARLADALRLSEPERRHLFDLAKGPGDTPEHGATEPVAPVADPAVAAFVRSYRHGLVMLYDPFFDLVAWNDVAADVFGLASQPAPINFLEWLATSDHARAVFVEPAADVILAVAVGQARASYAKYLSAGFGDLIERLCAERASFARLWSQHPIGPPLSGTYRIALSPEAERTIEVLSFAPSTAQGHTLVVMTPRPEPS